MRKIIIFLLTGLLLMLGCTDHFTELNEPQVDAVRTTPDLLFTRSLVTGAGISYTIWQLMNQTSTSAWVQHWANINPRFTGDNYEPSPANSVWNYYYAEQYFAPLNLNYQTMQMIKEGDNNPLKLACAQIWNVYLFHLLTDGFGDIPYSEFVIKSQPKFDAQEDIYKDMLKTLSESVESIKLNRNQGYIGFLKPEDVLYSGSLDNWIKFANSLILRLGLRVSNVAPDLGKSYIEKIDIGEVMNSNNESALMLTMPVIGAPTDYVKNPIQFVYGWNEVRISRLLMDYLDGTKYGVRDPRIAQFAQPAKYDNQFRGLENGQNDNFLGTHSDSIKNHFSNIGPFFNSTVGKVPIFLLTNAETQFLLAEAAWRGWLTGGQSAQYYYQAGITASMEQYRYKWDGTEAISAADEADYKIAPGVAYDAGKVLEQIITQKWIALYANGQEVWSEMRRTGFPKINPILHPYENNIDMPRRRLYPSAEISYNNANYQSAVTRMGGNSQYTRVWWDGGK